MNLDEKKTDFNLEVSSETVAHCVSPLGNSLSLFRESQYRRSDILINLNARSYNKLVVTREEG